jgi:hypothetical protein
VKIGWNGIALKEAGAENRRPRLPQISAGLRREETSYWGVGSVGAGALSGQCHWPTSGPSSTLPFHIVLFVPWSSTSVKTCRLTLPLSFTFTTTAGRCAPPGIVK